MLGHSCGRPNSNNCRLVISALLGVLISTYSEAAWAQKRALVVTAAPSGPDAETTSTEFVDIPGLAATIATAANGNLAITVTGEVETSSDRPVFVRALVDDEPVTPDDVVFAEGE